MPTAPGAPYVKSSFDATLSKAGFEGKTVPTLDAFFPFAKSAAAAPRTPPPFRPFLASRRLPPPPTPFF